MTRLIDLSISPGRPPRGVAVVAGAFAGEGPDVEGLPAELLPRFRGLARGARWRGERGQIAHGDGDPAVVLVGLGARSELDARGLAAWLQAAAELGARELRPRLALRPPAHETTRGVAAAATVLRTLAVAGYRFERFRSAPRPAGLDRIHLLPPPGEGPAYREAAGVSAAVAAGVATARDLANTPPSEASPSWLAEQARELARAHDIGVRVLGPAQLEKRGMNAILAVGRGSASPPRLVRLEWGRGKRRIALVGKGVTFDTGGISIKPSKSMDEMKYDKSGACAVLGIVRAAVELDLPFRFRAYLPLAENMPSGSSYRPSDIVRCYNGKTVEVLNTDAEGRMILADALALAAEEGADTLVELSTLTGATVVALGHHGAALYTPDDGLAGELAEASEASAERLWRMPLWREFGAEMRGNHADLRNVAGRWGGANCAAAFLGEFVGDLRRWAHLDIAGTAWVGADSGGTPGATGFGVALVLTWLLRQAGRL